MQRTYTAIQSSLIFFIFLFAFSSARAEVELSQLFADANPSVVTIQTYDANGVKKSQGSGFVVRPGIVVTSLHVLDGAQGVVVKTTESLRYWAKAIIKTNKAWDLALLKVKGLPLSALPIAASQKAKVGQKVIAIGSPLGFENTLSEGIISGIRTRSNKGMLQITNPISPGSSGGPVLTTTGKVVGVITLFVKGGQSLNFAVPSSEVSNLLLAAKRNKQIEQKLARLEDRAKSVTRVHDRLVQECQELSKIQRVIGQAIRVGAEVYNAGSHLACFRIYEGAGYKLLFSLKNRCKTATKILAKGLDAAQQATTPTAKAWAMRRSFDLILGEPTRTK